MFNAAKEKGVRHRLAWLHALFSILPESRSSLAPSARWQVTVTVRRDQDGFDFSGPFVRGDHTDRHLGLAWGDVPGDGTLRLFRGAKLRLVDIDSRIIEEAICPGHWLVARIRLTDAKGKALPQTETLLLDDSGREITALVLAA